MANSWWEDVFQAMFGNSVLGGNHFMNMGALTLTPDQRTKLLGESMASQKATDTTWANTWPQGGLSKYETPAASPSSATPAPAKPAAIAAPQVTATTAPTKPASGDTTVADALASDANPTDSASPLYGAVPAGNVYVGKGAKSPTTDPRHAGLGGRDVTMTLADSIASVNGWDKKKIAKFQELAIAAGFKDPGNNLNAIEDIWAQAALRSAKMYEQRIKVTPWALLSRWATDTAGAGGAKTTTSTSTVSDITNPKDASMLVDQLLSQRLGRAASAEEKKAFLAALNEAEKRNPKITTTSTTTNADGTTSNSKTSSKGGVNPTSFGQDWALTHNKDEAGSYQALATYMPALFAALGAPV